MKTAVRNPMMVITLILVISITSHAQVHGPKYAFSVGTSVFSSANGLGSMASPFLQLEKNRNIFTIGALFQKYSAAPKGMKFGFARNLSSENGSHNRAYKELLEINFVSYFQYGRDLKLCSRVMKVEKQIGTSSEENLNSIRMNTIEAGMGIELLINFTDNISWKNYICASVFHHMNYSTLLDQEKTAPGLTLGTGLIISLN